MEKRLTLRKTTRRVLALLLSCAVLAAAAGGAYLTRQQEAAEVLSKMGSRGEEVRRIQQKLTSLGYFSSAIDGIYGTRTQSAVRSFQRDRGLAVDGIAGPKTLAALGLSSSSSGGGQYSSNDLYLLAKVIAAEARGEPYTGQVAVGAVVLNRVSHASFPDTIPGVVYQSGAFTCVTDSNWKVEPTAEAKKAARDAINGWDPTGGAIYYYNPKKTSSKWMLSRPVLVTIGDHRFCK